MGFRKWIAKKIVGDERKIYPNPETLDDEVREESIRIRRIKAEKRKIIEEIELLKLRAELDDLKAELLDGDEEAPESSEDMILKLVAPLLLGKTINGGQNTNVQTPFSGEVAPATEPPVNDLSEEQLNNIIDNVPRKYLKMARALDDDTLKGIILKQFPGATENDIKGLIQRLRR